MILQGGGGGSFNDSYRKKAGPGGFLYVRASWTRDKNGGNNEASDSGLSRTAGDGSESQI